MIDFNLNPGKMVQSNDIDLILQQIDILFDTIPGETFGDVDFGSQYDDYLYRLNLSAEDIKSNVLSDINSINLFGFIPTVEVYLLQGIFVYIFIKSARIISSDILTSLIVIVLTIVFGYVFNKLFSFILSKYKKLIAR